MSFARRVVLDTGVLVSAAIRPDSIPALALEKALLNFAVCVSHDTLTELETVLSRSKFDRYAPALQRQAFVAGFRAQTLVLEVTVTVTDCPDLKDNMSPGQCMVTDTITGEYRKAVACFHLHPAIVAEPAIKGQDSGAQGYLRLPGGQRVQWSLTAGQAQLAPSLWRPEFGHSVPTHCLKVRIIDGKCRMAFSWADND